ncbi:uncharacterized protein IWZ02DRAFT_74065 [Phyllosticta citriasiana]|uniref:Secreted protein n=1 Tax=Phyllosticta citriasiana TaxID=595635 RepID=A0ABR1KSW4_9PEZI
MVDKPWYEVLALVAAISCQIIRASHFQTVCLAFWRVAVFLCSSSSVSLNSVGGLSSQRMLDVGFLLHHATPFDMLAAQTDAHQSCWLTALILRKQKKYLALYSDTSARPLRRIFVPPLPHSNF